MPASFTSADGTVYESETQKFFEQDVSIIEPGILPSSFWYWADNFAEDIRFVFTVGKEKKVDFLLQLAAERLAEMKILSEQGITQHADRLTRKHEESISRAQEIYEQIREDGWQEVQAKQSLLEGRILETEYMLRGELKNAPANYENKRDGFAASIAKGFKSILGHLGSKKNQISDQRSGMTE